jgi:hypothetical protein
MIVGLSLGIVVGLAGTSACSSTSTNDDEKGGSGAVITAGSGGTGGTAGASSTAGTPGGGTAGSAVVGCPGMPVTCVDAMNAQACNPDTNMVETVNCKDEFAKSGLISAGCTTDPSGSGCTVDGGADETCWNGAQGIAVCADLDDQQFLNAYVNCFNDVPEARTLLTCIADFVDVDAMSVDCEGAEPVCAPEGAGGAAPDGTGGAPDGAGGAP